MKGVEMSWLNLKGNIEYEVYESTMADLLAVSIIWWWLIVQLSWHLAAV